MIPKEKAKELVTTYRFSLSIPNAPLGDLKDSIAKQCALIAVDEILNVISENTIEPFVFDIDYWKEVKTEIINL